MRSQTEQAYKERLLQVLVYIQQHLDEAIALDDLARVAHFSPYHFHRLFRVKTKTELLGGRGERSRSDTPEEDAVTRL